MVRGSVLIKGLADVRGLHPDRGRPMSLNHVSLTVADREASAAFYGHYFGMSKRVHDDDHLLILADKTGGLLALVAGQVPGPFPPANHFGFQAASAQDVRDLRDRFAADGIPEAEFQPKGPTRVQVFDPDGNRVEAFAF